MKRSLTAPLVGLGLGASALGGAAYVGGGTHCTEGRVVRNTARSAMAGGAAPVRLTCSAAGEKAPNA